MGKLDGKVAMVTGGARGQGLCHAAKLASEGADIVLVDVPRDDLELFYKTSTKADLDDAAELIRRSGRRCVAKACDVRDQDGLHAVVEDAVAELGRLDILCANAGIVDMDPAWTMAERRFQDVIDINLGGIWKSVRAVARPMMEQRSGAIVVTTSVNSTEAFADMTGYVAAKHGALGLVRSFALELGKFGIRVNAVAPGVVSTPMSDNEGLRSRLFGRPNATIEEYFEVGHNWTALRNTTAIPASAIADAAAWLASDEARYIHGHELVVDAGHLLMPGHNHAPVIDEENVRADYAGHALSHLVEQPRA